MKRNIIYTIIILLSLISCNDWLSVYPKSEKETSELFKKERGFEDALIGCYGKMNNTSLYGWDLTVSNLDIMAQLWQSVEAEELVEYIPLLKFDYQSDKSQQKFNSVYSGLYNIVVQANSILEYMNIYGDVIKSPIKRDIIKGEALALRAFCHFDLLRIFGQVPTSNATINVSLPYSEFVGIEKSPLYSFVDFTKKIEKDLLSALEYLKEDPVNSYTINSLNDQLEFLKYDIDGFLTFRRFRLNYVAVKALLARYYLYIGDNEKALTFAKEVINAKTKDDKSIIELAGDNDFNYFNNALPSETIFGISNSALEGNSLLTNKLYITQEYKDDLFSGRDIASNNRYNSVWGRQVTVMGAEHPYLRKYDQNRDNNEKLSESEKIKSRWLIPIIRLSEIYLIAMEASTDLAEVNDLYIKYMLARNEKVSPFSTLDAAKKEIIKEYRREFIGEGQVFYMYKRMNSTSMEWCWSQIEEKNYVVSVPISEITK